MIRLDKILSNMGFGTRREVKLLIRSGRIKIDGEIVKNADTKLDTDKNLLTVDDVSVVYKEFIYLMLNKPQGYVSATEDNLHKAVTELVPPNLAHYDLFPVGRLDIDTEGLIILTNDGQFTHNLLSPKKHVPKVYFAKPLNEISDEDISAFQQGMDLDDFTTLPAKLENCEGGCLVTIYEGKFHQVKRMFEKIDNKVLYLKRIQMGGLKLDEELDLGEMRELTKEEIEKIWI